MLMGTQAAGYRTMPFSAQPRHRVWDEAGMLPCHHGGPGPARTALSPAGRPPVWGGLCSRGIQH